MRRRPKTGLVLYVETNFMRRFLWQIVQLLQDGTSTRVDLIWCVSQSPQRGRDSRGQAITLRELDRAVDGPQTISRTDVCCFVPGGTGWALPEPHWRTSSRPPVWVSLPKQSEADFLRPASGRDVLYPCPAPWSSIGIRYRTPELARPPLAPCAFHRLEQVHPEQLCRSQRERYAACKMVQHDRCAGGSVMVCFYYDAFKLLVLMRMVGQLGRCIQLNKPVDAVRCVKWLNSCAFIIRNLHAAIGICSLGDSGAGCKRFAKTLICFRCKVQIGAGRQMPGSCSQLLPWPTGEWRMWTAVH